MSSEPGEVQRASDSSHQPCALGCRKAIPDKGGSAFAASRYLITSPRQIKPSVRKALTGRTGKRGSAGPAGSAGVGGVAGIAGSAGAAGTPGAPGRAGPTGPTGPMGPSFARTVVVSPVGSATANGTALLNAMSGISGASTANPYLLLIEPGVYDLGTSTLDGKADVDIQGSGQDVTTIESEPTVPGGIAINQAANSEIRSLTLQQTSLSPVGIYISDGAGPASLRDVTVSVTSTNGGSLTSFGAITVSQASTGITTLVNTTATATGSGAPSAFYSAGAATIEGGSYTATSTGGTGQAVRASPLTATGMSAQATGATGSSLAVVTASGTSRVQSSTLAPGYLETGGTLDIAASEVSGNTIVGGIACVDDWKPDLSAATSTCG